MNYEDFDAMRMSIDNLKLVKLAYDAGVDIKKFPSVHVDGHELDPYVGWTILDKILESTFDIIEYYYPNYSSENESREDKIYWLEQAGIKVADEVDSDGIAVVLDDRLEQDYVPSGTVHRGSTYDWYYGYAEIFPFEKGFLIIYNEEDGSVDLIPVLEQVLEIRKQILKRGEVYEMAV